MKTKCLIVTCYLLFASIANASLLIPSVDRVDHVFDASRNILYVSTESGTIDRWDMTTQQLLTPLSVGTSLRGMDISPDNQFMYVADAVAGSSEGFFHRVNLDTGEVTNLSYQLDFGENGSWDVALGSNGLGLLSTNYGGSGWVPLRQIDLSDDSISDANPPTFNGEVRQRTHLTRSADRSIIFLQESNTSAGPIHVYDAVSGTFLASMNTGSSLSSQHAAVSYDGSLIAMELGGGVSIYDTSLNLVELLSIGTEGILFDPTGGRFFVADPDTDELIAFSTSTWQELNRWDIGENYSTGPWWEYGGAMSITPDGQTIFLSTDSGIRAITAVPVPAAIWMLGSGIALLLGFRRRLVEHN